MRKLLIIMLGIFIFVLMMVGLFFLQGIKKPKENFPMITQSPTTQLPNTNKPPVNYNVDGMKKLIKTMQERPTPIPADSSIREVLIKEAVSQNGIIHESNAIKIEYLEAPNTFEVQLKQYPIEPAMEESYAFLRQKGLTNDGICKLPLSFNLTQLVSNKFRESGEMFGPYPEFCK